MVGSGAPAWGWRLSAGVVTWRRGVRRMSAQGAEQAQLLTQMWMFPQVVAGVWDRETGCEPCRGKILGQ